jgi:hypothetical protein
MNFGNHIVKCVYDRVFNRVLNRARENVSDRVFTSVYDHVWHRTRRFAWWRSLEEINR